MVGMESAGCPLTEPKKAVQSSPAQRPFAPGHPSGGEALLALVHMHNLELHQVDATLVPKKSFLH